jgi:hypothetical protein
MQSFINKYSYKCLLGPQSKEVDIVGNIAKWKVNKKHHFTNLEKFNADDLSYLKTYGPSNFHYLTDDNFALLKSNGFTVSRTKVNGTYINIENLSYSGRKYHGIRGSINKNSKLKLTIQDNFNKIEDVKAMIDEWSKNMGEKYFRDFSGKTFYFYKNNFHLDCDNTFIYDGPNLIAFATLSYGEYSAYIVGKALFNRYPGLSEYADDLAYRKAAARGTKIVNLGRSIGKLGDYKNKFPNAYSALHYDGNIL